METTSYSHPSAVLRTPATISSGVIVGPESNSRCVVCPLASSLTCVPPTSITSTFIACSLPGGRRWLEGKTGLSKVGELRRACAHIDDAAGRNHVQPSSASRGQQIRAFAAGVEPDLAGSLGSDLVEKREANRGRNVHAHAIELFNGNVRQRPIGAQPFDRVGLRIHRINVVSSTQVRADRLVSELSPVNAGAEDGNARLGILADQGRLPRNLAPLY